MDWSLEQLYVAMNAYLPFGSEEEGIVSFFAGKKMRLFFTQSSVDIT
jgi:hypothetical protein